MNPKRSEIVAKTERYVRSELYAETSGHDWWHVARVRKLALFLAKSERANTYIAELAALLHDISDYKLNGGDHEKGPRVTYEWLCHLGESEECAQEVASVVSGISFKGAGVKTEMPTLEGKVVQDADRLDAIGAIGIARAFTYGGFTGELIYDPDVPPRLHNTHEEYLARNGTVIGHFYEKLFLLKERMNTATGLEIALRRHAFMEKFVDEFFIEWEGRDIDAARKQSIEDS
jgi:uncharacterized protein